ncbi:CBO0543 family protein [Gracilibacillus sp. YIM 98692]|uniref:CBO0543 family protein n=1 Tax=Gracilibacillus sp. YIM 98692 TaxID=2663532 RepID=UPI0013D0E369|nr:CBO0543 family protein [Gracilibacillus sp. YIM 98692]
MEKYILWGLLLLGLVLLILSFKKSRNITQWLLIFFMQAYFSTFIGVIVVEKKMVEYPVKFLPHFFETSILYEYLLFPVVNIYYYQTTYHSKLFGIIIQTLFYSAGLTILEVGVFEKYTELVEYHAWTWIHTFSSIFLLMLFIRGMMKLVCKISNKE